jgi:hypothetical protein
MDEALVISTLAGATCRAWDFMATHDQLVVKLKLPSGETKFLCATMCSRISMPTSWRFTNPRIERRDEYHYALVDEGVEIVCEELLLGNTDMSWPRRALDQPTASE